VTGSASPSPEITFEFDKDFQWAILSLFLKHPNALTKYRHLIKSNYFTDTVTRNLCEWCLNYYDHYNLLSHCLSKPFTRSRNLLQQLC